MTRHLSPGVGFKPAIKRSRVWRVTNCTTRSLFTAYVIFFVPFTDFRIRLAALYVCVWYQPDGDDPRGVPQEGDNDKGEDPVEAGGWNPVTRGTCSHPWMGGRCVVARAAWARHPLEASRGWSLSSELKEEPGHAVPSDAGKRRSVARRILCLWSIRFICPICLGH